MVGGIVIGLSRKDGKAHVDVVFPDDDPDDDDDEYDLFETPDED